MVLMDSDNRIKAIIKKLAGRVELCKNFEDIIVVENPKMPSVAGVNMKTKELYINLSNDFLTFNELLNNIVGIMAHENGHNDNRLKVPCNYVIFDEHVKELKRHKIRLDDAKFWLNFVYDMEIHHQYNKRCYLKPKMQIALQEFITLTRNRVFEKSKDDLVLSLSYPTTNIQKKVKSIIEDRNITVVEKVIKLIKATQDKKGKGKGKGIKVSKITVIIEGSDNEDDNGKNNDKSKKVKAVRIKHDIEQEHGKNELINKLKSIGFSEEEIMQVLKRENISDEIDKIQYLEDSLKDIVPNLDNERSKQKTREKCKNGGYRINGYKRLSDISDITKNIEDMATIGKYDINDIRIPYKISRMARCNMLILRDTSASINCSPINKMVRDITVTLIKMAKKNRYKIGIVDFHSHVEPIYDKSGNILTDNYNMLLLDSMDFKLGSSTRLTEAIKFVNDEIIGKNKDIPLNVFIITDGEVNYEEGVKFNGNNIVVRGICTLKNDDSEIHPHFRNTVIKDNKGKIYKVYHSTINKLITELVKDAE